MATKKMEEAFAKATLARQPRIEELEKMGAWIDAEIEKLQDEIVNEVVEILTREASQKLKQRSEPER